MRLNEETVLVGSSVVLVPYRKEHVPQYHEWMQSPILQEQTASEPLTLEQEYEMQAKWHLDEDKLTFIVLHKEDAESAESVERLLARCRMAGDVNVFLSEDAEEEEEDEGARTQKQLRGEMEVMIAEPSLRRHGLASQALQLLMHYVTQEQPTSKRPLLSPFNLFVKVGLSNSPSRALFARLGFEEVKVSEVWQEVEMRYTRGEGSAGMPPQRVLRWARD
ncbi:acyl-CoA N-acyltransferase [Jaminaea rosea]|uniref:Acyl-CoA N-acyltransferase n=1 Tax=Jaminaea rosea TaxID=1569628 RepID=A0A316UWA7_9BASI|nr:acyl-CoA N-acyltransferase [Jaminaea rosea]PWN29284.1 acyl-CoA N-acyltransferase [Jaminaea rosea]